MKARIEPGPINGTIHIPPSKSITQRAYAAALLFASTTLIRNAGHSADEEAALHIIEQLGATITYGSNTTIVSQGIAPISNAINCGESGLAARLFAPIAALHHQPLTITGYGSLTRRPMEGFSETLTQLGATLPHFTGYLPVTIHGPLKAQDITVNTSGSSQLLSGLLFAVAAIATQPISITVHGLQSKPYIDLTLDVLAQFGRPITHKDYRLFRIDPASFTRLPTRDFTIESDWSSASCMLVAGAIAGEITIPNLHTNSKQADRAVIEVLLQAGANMTITNESITTSRSALSAFEFDATNCPDLFPALAALASFCNGGSSIRGVHRLFHKESNRVESITEMLWRYGVTFSVEDDTLYIEGRERLQYCYIDGYKDHRIVMAAAICALRAKGAVTITCADAVSKSYPDFFRHLQQCGVIYEMM
jgi:3-phosphoshikimate 1-carboxyvinyltransferase